MIGINITLFSSHYCFVCEVNCVATSFTSPLTTSRKLSSTKIQNRCYSVFESEVNFSIKSFHLMNGLSMRDLIFS